MSDGLKQQHQRMEINFKAHKNEESSNQTYVIGSAPSESVFRDFFNSTERQKIKKAMMASPLKLPY